MRLLSEGFALVVILGLGACANNPNGTTSTGQTPQPVVQSVPFSPDALGSMGSMQIPASSMGNLRSH